MEICGRKTIIKEEKINICRILSHKKKAESARRICYVGKQKTPPGR